MNEIFSQGGKGSVGILTNKQAIARHFGVKQSEVVYFEANKPLNGYKVIYDKENQRSYMLPVFDAPVNGVSLLANGILNYTNGSVDLGALASDRGEFIYLSGSFSTGGVLQTKNEALAHNGTFYQWAGALPKTVPVAGTPETTGGISDTAWVAVGLTGLQRSFNQFSESTNTSIATINKKFERDVYLDDEPSVLGNGTSDDSVGIQALILDVAKNGGGRINGSYGKTYFIGSTVLIPSNIVIDLNGSTLKGNRAVSSVPMFETAYLDGDVLKSNITSANETHLVYNSVFCNGFVRDTYIFLNAKNFIKGCGIENIQLTNCAVTLVANRCFYSSYINVFTSGGSLPTVAAFQLTGQNNAMYFERVTTTVEYGYLISGGSTAITWKNCTFEGGTIGFDIQGDAMGLHWDSCYFEAVPGTLFRFLYAETCNVKFTANYINTVDVVIQGGGLANSNIFGDWDESNAIVGVGAVVEGFTYRGLVALSNNRDYLQFKLRPSINDVSAALPSNISTGKSADASQVHILEATGPGDVMAKGLVSGGVVSRRFSGDPGKTAVGVIPFCTSEVYVPDTYANAYVRVSTKIVFSDLLRATFRINVVASGTNVLVYGDVYGSSVKKADESTTVVSVENDGTGFLRFVLGPMNIPGGSMAATGFVQML